MAWRIEMDEYFTFREFRQGLVFRVIMFCFLGIGWDMVMTFIQQIIAGRITIDAINPVSAWMMLAYGSIPFLFYPVSSLGRYMKLPYAGRVLVILAVFYFVEFAFGSTMRLFGITPWSYDWFIDPKWSLRGIITWHPVILAAWIVFVMLVEWTDYFLRISYPVIRDNMVMFWRR